MKLRSLLATAFAAVILSAAAAHASTYYVTYTGTGVSGAFTIDTTGSTITSIHGTTDGEAITGLLPGADGGDEQFNPAFPHFSFAGLSYGTTTQDINLYYNGAGEIEENFTAGNVDTPITVSVAATPEPSSLMLLGTGVFGAAGMARRRFFKS